MMSWTMWLMYARVRKHSICFNSPTVSSEHIGHHNNTLLPFENVYGHIFGTALRRSLPTDCLSRETVLATAVRQTSTTIRLRKAILLVQDVTLLGSFS